MAQGGQGLFEGGGAVVGGEGEDAGARVEVRAVRGERREEVQGAGAARGVGEGEGEAFAADAGLEGGGGALGDDPAVVDDGDGVGQLVGLLQVLGGEQHGGAGGDQFPYALPGVGAAARVEAGGGFVQDDHGRAGDQRPGEVEAAPHPAGVGAAGPVGRLRQAEAVEEFGGAPAGGAASRAVQAGHQVQVLAAGQLLVDGGVLAGEAEAGPDRLGGGADVVARHPGAARVGPQQGGEDADGGGLAGAVGTEQAEDGAGRGVQVDPGEGLLGAEALGEPFGAQGGPVAGCGAGAAHAATVRRALRGVRSVQCSST